MIEKIYGVTSFEDFTNKKDLFLRMSSDLNIAKNICKKCSKKHDKLFVVFETTNFEDLKLIYSNFYKLEKEQSLNKVNNNNNNVITNKELSKEDSLIKKEKFDESKQTHSKECPLLKSLKEDIKKDEVKNKFNPKELYFFDKSEIKNIIKSEQNNSNSYKKEELNYNSFKDTNNISNFNNEIKKINVVDLNNNIYRGKEVHEVLERILDNFSSRLDLNDEDENLMFFYRI